MQCYMLSLVQPPPYGTCQPWCLGHHGIYSSPCNVQSPCLTSLVTTLFLDTKNSLATATTMNSAMMTVSLIIRSARGSKLPCASLLDSALAILVIHDGSFSFESRRSSGGRLSLGDSSSDELPAPDDSGAGVARTKCCRSGRTTKPGSPRNCWRLTMGTGRTCACCTLLWSLVQRCNPTPPGKQVACAILQLVSKRALAD